VACWYCVRRLPHTLASAREEPALGAAPVVVSHAVLRMRLEPTVERAAAFAAEADDGRLARSIGAHVRRVRGTPVSGLGAWGDEWGERFPALRRAASLVEAAGRAPASDRSRTLDRATEAILDGARDRTASAAAALRGPVTALYAFGVLLPLALVAVLPAASVAGVGVTLPVVVALYDLVLPVTLGVASAWLVVRRPATFPATPVPSDHPALPDRRWPAPAGGVATAGLAWVAADTFFRPWSAPLAALGAGVGVALVGWFRPTVAVCERAWAVEDGLPDALALVGRRVGRGRAVESAIDAVAEEVAGPMGEVLDDAARHQRTLRVGLGEALYGDHGALATVPSARVESTLGLLVVAACEGAPAGDALVVVADHVERLRSVEREARRDLRRATTTLTNTAADTARPPQHVVRGVADGNRAALQQMTEEVRRRPASGRRTASSSGTSTGRSTTSASGFRSRPSRGTGTRRSTAGRSPPRAPTSGSPSARGAVPGTRCTSATGLRSA